VDPAVKLAGQVNRGTDRIGFHTHRLCADDLNKSIARGNAGRKPGCKSYCAYFWQAEPLERLADTEMRRHGNADRGTSCPAPQRGYPEGTDPGLMREQQPNFGRSRTRFTSFRMWSETARRISPARKAQGVRAFSGTDGVTTKENRVLGRSVSRQLEPLFQANPLSGRV